MNLLFILYTTGKCNLKCRYCGGSFDPKTVPWNVKYSLKLLEEVFREGDSIAFYGGEPLLNRGFIREVMETFQAKHYIIQTNGLLLRNLDQRILERFDTILVSIDGGREITDANRGSGVYDRVLSSVRYVRSLGYAGDLVARMTITNDSDIYRDVSHLLDLGLFDHVHWQLSMIWVDRGDWRDLWGWIGGSYKPGLKRLFWRWLSSLEKGELLGVAPFQGILKRIIEGGPRPPCGSGEDSFTILTDGRIISCPIAVRERWAEIGVLGEVSRKDLEGRRNELEEPCRSCSLLGICGSRCLYANREKLWGSEGDRAVCETSRYIINLVLGNYWMLKDILSKTPYTMRDLVYPEYNNTVEIIP